MSTIRHCKGKSADICIGKGTSSQLGADVSIKTDDTVQDLKRQLLIDPFSMLKRVDSAKRRGPSGSEIVAFDISAGSSWPIAKERIICDQSTPRVSWKERQFCLCWKKESIAFSRATLHHSVVSVRPLWPEGGNKKASPKLKYESYRWNPKRIIRTNYVRNSKALLSNFHCQVERSTFLPLVSHLPS